MTKASISSSNHSIQSALLWASDHLKSIPNPRLDATLLLAHVLEKTNAYLMTYPEKIMSSEQWSAFSNMCVERSKGQPIAYLLGDAFFLGRRFFVNQYTLVPRPETEELVEWCLSLTSDAPCRCADVGAGSGVIAVSLALARPAWAISAIDISQEALAVASKNAEYLDAKRISFLQQDALNFREKEAFDLLISNPPYIDKNDPHLQGDGVCCEPRMALVAGEKGLAFIRKMIVEARSYLSVGGMLMLEHGYDQGDAVCSIFKENGYSAIEQLSDSSGKYIFAKANWFGGVG